MHWQSADLSLLLHHLPKAVQDLLHHENKALVRAHLPLLKPAPALSVPDTLGISLEKTLDPMVQRSAQNIGLLLHDYLDQLPAIDASGPEAEALLEHWRELLLTQPQRLSTAHPSHWHEEKLKAFWRDRLLAHHAPLKDHPFTAAWDDWHHLSAITPDPITPAQLHAMQKKQWQDLVIRTRLHQESARQRWDG